VRRRRTRSIAKGAIAGLIAGIVATAAKSAAEKIYPPHDKLELPPPRPPQIGGRELKILQSRAAQETIHWGFGAAVGAAYGAVAEYYPPATAKQGAQFGMAMVALTHDATLPIVGRLTKPEVETKREKTSEIASYIVYGVVTETVRSIVRRMIN
jgi:putative membrane protein